jgi:HK97 family phage portal protein
MGILATIERRAHPANPDRWFIQALTGRSADTATGVMVDGDSALSSTAVFAAVRLISETLASVPLKLYERLERGKTEAPDHPLYRLLHAEPNAEQTSIEFREMMEGFRQTHGNAFAQIVWGRDGYARELWPITPHRVRADRDGAGNLRYLVRTPDQQDVPVRAEDMLHIRGFSRDGVLGFDVIDQLRESIGLTLATQEFGARFFGNNANPGGVLEHPTKLSPEAHQRLRGSWEEKHRGLHNSHRVAILEEGMKWTQMGVPPEAAQYLETRKFQIAEIARMFNLPPHLLRDLERATFSNIEQQAIEFVTYTMRPHYVRWEQSLNKKLLLPRERGRFFAQHVIEGLLRGDIKTRYEAYAVGRTNGWLSANDIRELEDMNPIEAGGDLYLVPLNMIPADQAAEPREPAPPPPAADPEPEPESDSEPVPARSAAFDLKEYRRARSAGARQRLREVNEPLIAAAAAGVLAKEINAVRRALKKSLGARDAASFRIWLDEYYEQHGEDWTRALFPYLRAYAQMVTAEASEEVGGTTGADLDAFVRSYAQTFGAAQAGKSLGQLRAILRDTPIEDAAAAIEERLAEWEETRPGKIGRREATQAMNAFSVEAYALLGVTVLRWQATGQDCPLCAMLSGRTVGTRTAFLGAGVTVDPEDGVTVPLVTSYPIMHPPLHAGCDCYITPD